MVALKIKDIRSNQLMMIELNVIALTIIFYLFRATIPFLKLPFILCYISLIVYTAIIFRHDINAVLKDFFSNFYLSIILLIIIVAAFLLSSKLYLIIFKDIFNSLILLSIFFLMGFYVRSQKGLSVLFDKLIQFIIFLALIVSFLFLTRFITIVHGNNELSSNKSLWSLSFRALSADYNFVVLPVLFGLISLLSISIERKTFLKKTIYISILIIFLAAIILSGSRRSVITLLFIILFFLFGRFFGIVYENEILNKIQCNSKLITQLVIALLILFFGFIFILPVKSKRNLFTSLEISPRSYKSSTLNLFFKYSLVIPFAKSKSLSDILWKGKPNSLYPDFGWDLRVGTLVFPLSGENKEIVPVGSFGYKMDRKSDATTWNNNAYSYTDITSIFKGDTIKRNSDLFFASVYCYVSEDFDGSWARISAEGSSYGNIIKEYDLNRKGVWQKLTIRFKSKNDLPPVFLYWAKNGVKDFSNINGYIIFAYPEYTKKQPDPKDPLIWGTRLCYLDFPLTGNNVKIVPVGSIGYKMDSTSDASTWNNNAYSFTDISSLFTDEPINGNALSCIASVYCYLSEDFDGSWAGILAEGGATGNISDEYDFNYKGKWQKLNIDFESNSEIPPVYLYWSKSGVRDFKKLRGYIIFAYPEYRISNDSHYILSLKEDSFSKSIRDIVLYSNPNQSDISSVYKNNNLVLNLNNIIPEAYNSDNKDFNSKKKIIVEDSSVLCQFNASFFPAFSPIIAGLMMPIDNESDRIRSWAAKFISEDTTYYGYKSNLVVDTILEGYGDDRIIRWQFAWKIFVKEYSWKQRTLGGGFDFLNWYGFYFMKDKKFSDYPHNPFLSILLYSGMVGLCIYILFLHKVVYYYIKFSKHYIVFFILFIVTFFFSFFSAGSPFDPPVMGFLIMLPFFIYGVHRKDRLNC